MVSKKHFVLFLLAAFFASCKKDYQCQCTNSFGAYDAGDPVEARSKKKADKLCAELSTTSTSCKAK